MRLQHKEELRRALASLAGEGSVLADEPMSLHTTFRIGGPADFLVQPSSAEAVRGIVRLLRENEIPLYIVGNGSNLLVSDGGYRGVIVQLGRQFSDIEVSGEQIRAQAGALLSRTAAEAAEASLTGLEFASGIPGTVGGACLMNAGAYDGEMKQVLTAVTCLGPDSELRTVPAEEAGLSYRHSAFMDSGDIVLEAFMKLRAGDAEAIRARMEELRKQRTSKQPLDLPSAGSTFKRPEGYFAGKLIMEADLRGYRVGDAQVSEKHCGFVVNRGHASAGDVFRLIQDVRERVLAHSGVELTPEVRFLGDF